MSMQGRPYIVLPLTATSIFSRHGTYCLGIRVNILIPCTNSTGEKRCQVRAHKPRNDQILDYILLDNDLMVGVGPSSRWQVLVPGTELRNVFTCTGQVIISFISLW